MHERNDSEILILRLQFTMLLSNPFELNYKLYPTKFQLDISSFVSEGLKDLVYFYVENNKESEPYDLAFTSVFELKVDIKAKRYQKILSESKPGPPISDVKFHDLEDRHKILVYGLIKHIAWQKGIDAFEPYKKVKRMDME